jgi:hypothetical protein
VHSSPPIVRVISRIGPGEREPLLRCRHRYNDNIKMGFKEAECEGVEWIQLTHNRV